MSDKVEVFLMFAATVFVVWLFLSSILRAGRRDK